MELLQLRYFVTVARMLNISHAARHHMIPQPAMSKTISRLEQELGVALFDRYKNKLTLTESGQILYHSLSRSLGEIDSAISIIKNQDSPISGEVKILVRQHRATVVDCIMEFKKRYPKVLFRIDYDQAASNEEYDLCISCERPTKEMDSSLCLITEPLRLVLSKEHPLAALAKVPFHKLKEQEFVTIHKDSYMWRSVVLECQKEGFEPPLSITCGDLYCLMKYIRTGLAITIGPAIAWKDLMHDSIVFVRTTPEISRSTFVFWNGQKKDSRLFSEFRSFLAQYFTNLQNENI
ncbi:MAG: LysR family transcriptional regulator [Clostridia bacterium]|nr:LysR family transcriptional regulator [Clostridia bacterium]